jgi:cytoskeletal protein CcmA (bactofilin family)
MKGAARMIRPYTAIVVVTMLTASWGWSVAQAASETSKVNGSIDIAAGEQAGRVSTVNGAIHIGANAVVGAADTVNGGISLESHASAAKLTTVNGSIQLREAARVSGPVSTVNGQLTLADGAEVSGSLQNVNGLIKVAAAHVAGGIETVTGGIELGPNARVEGGIRIEEDTSWFGWFFGWLGLGSGNVMPRVVIGPGTVVAGTLRFERPVKLYVSERATIGKVVGATPVRFSGEQPPQ